MTAEQARKLLLGLFVLWIAVNLLGSILHFSLAIIGKLLPIAVVVALAYYVYLYYKEAKK